MKTYIKFLITTFYTSFFYVLGVMFSLVFILNILTEFEFFRNKDIGTFYIIFLSILNSPSMIFEMFPFIFLISSQLFFVKLLNNNEIEIFKYSGLKNSKLITILGVISIITGILITLMFYNLSSKFKNIYLEIKSQYTIDGKYLAVINKNGLWIKDRINKKNYIINSNKIEDNFLIDSFITEFDESYNVVRNIRAEKIDIRDTNWKILNANVYENNSSNEYKKIFLLTNFDYNKIQSLYSSLTSFSILELLELRRNYKKLNYSLVEIDLQLLKLVSFPFYLLLMMIFASLIMLKTKRLSNVTIKLCLGLFFSVIIYYMNNFFYVMGSTERLNLFTSIFAPLIMLSLIIIIMMRNINEN